MVCGVCVSVLIPSYLRSFVLSVHMSVLGRKKNRCDLEKYLWSFFCYLYMVINRFGMVLFSGVVGGGGSWSSGMQFRFCCYTLKCFSQLASLTCLCDFSPSIFLP